MDKFEFIYGGFGTYKQDMDKITVYKSSREWRYGIRAMMTLENSFTRIGVSRILEIVILQLPEWWRYEGCLLHGI